MAKSTPIVVAVVGLQATLFGTAGPRGGPQLMTFTPAVVPEESKNPGPPNGTVQNAVPPPTPKRAVTGQPTKNEHTNVEPVGVTTAVKSVSILSPVLLVNWF
jgi:hypothetical protein